MTNGAVITTTEYAGNYIYQNNALQMINQPEGYLEPNGQGGYDYGYRLKDHLGNIRITFVDFDHNGSIALSEITEENNFYPFGLKHQGYNTTVSSNANAIARKFKYNGKELQDDGFDTNSDGKNDLQLDLYDYGARFYDPELGRWHVVDPLANKYVNLSPYSYTANNPILYIDPDGQKIVIANNTSRALTNLAMIAATSQGRQRLDRLISSRHTYTARSTFWSSSSAYDGNGEIGSRRTAYYVGSAWRPSVGGGAMSSMYAMGHEFNHAYDHDITGSAGNRDRKSRERSSVNFTNYLRSVHGDGDDMRTNYSGLGLGFSGNENVYNNQNEKVTDFTQTLDVSFGGNTVMGFSYSTSTNGEEATMSYTISLKTESGQYAYRVFDSKKEYDAAVGRIQNLKKKEDEKE